MQQTGLRTRALVTLAVGFLVLFVGGGARFAMGLTLKPMVDELGWVRGDVGSAVALFQFVSAACMFAAGRFSDRLDPRIVLGAGLLLAGAGIGLMAVVTAHWQVLLVYGVLFAAGNGIASLIPVGVLVTRAFPGRTGAANSVVVAGMSVGQLVLVGAMAAALAAAGWRSLYVWLALLHFVALLPLFLVPSGRKRAHAHAEGAAPRAGGLSVRAAARQPRFWTILAIYAVCGFEDFFVATHIVAFAQDRGVDAFLAGNLLALMGLAGLLGLFIAGIWSDRSGPAWPTAASFAARLAVFALVAVDQSPFAIAVFALVFGMTFLVIAPLTVLFVRDGFGLAHLGALTGLITMVHHVCGGLGAYLGAALFDATGSYDPAFRIVLALSVLGLLLSLATRKAPRLDFGS
ncbi:MFS transporter [Propylenella binzhouense]|uniref:MFS transporter n=1 Tax=Propylenella binzhouense TaxID=2555902 RepID=A0A964T7A3_9HYPH|nr:MFS transporter [Propylenella binzhouense]MYZ49740.1 MFS transporter [Propylenella binzhouense]